MAFAQFMNSPAGRILRIVAGLVLIGVGLGLQGAVGVAMVVVGAIPLAAGALDFCLLAPFLSLPWSGRKIRAMKE